MNSGKHYYNCQGDRSSMDILSIDVHAGNLIVTSFFLARVVSKVCSGFQKWCETG